MRRKFLMFVVPAAAIGVLVGAWGADGELSFIRKASAYTETWPYYHCFPVYDVCPVCPAGTPRQGNSQCDTNIYPYQWGDCEFGYPSNCTTDSDSCGPDLDCINFPQQRTGGNNCNVGVYQYCG